MGFATGWGRAQLARLAEQSRLAVADSAFNRSELVVLGFDPTAVVPLLVDPCLNHRLSARPGVAGFDGPAAPVTLGGADLLFVGKVSPHKAPHDLVKMLSVLRQVWDPQARLHLVGSALGMLCTSPASRAFISDLGLDDAVFLPGSVTGAEMEAYYRTADVFVSASEHEGFGCSPGRGHGARRAGRRLRGGGRARDGGWGRSAVARQVTVPLRGPGGPACARRRPVEPRPWRWRVGPGWPRSIWRPRNGPSWP